MSPWAAFWLLWIAQFLIAEFAALRDAALGDTLSENVWSVLNHPTYGKFLTWMLAAFLVWLTVHLVTRGRWA